MKRINGTGTPISHATTGHLPPPLRFDWIFIGASFRHAYYQSADEPKVKKK